MNFLPSLSLNLGKRGGGGYGPCRAERYFSRFLLGETRRNWEQSGEIGSNCLSNFRSEEKCGEIGRNSLDAMGVRFGDGEIGSNEEKLEVIAGTNFVGIEIGRNEEQRVLLTYSANGCGEMRRYWQKSEEIICLAKSVNRPNKSFFGLGKLREPFGTPSLYSYFY
jgi:hypothetical protein